MVSAGEMVDRVESAQKLPSDCRTASQLGFWTTPSHEPSAAET